MNEAESFSLSNNDKSCVSCWLKKTFTNMFTPFETSICRTTHNHHNKPKYPRETLQRFLVSWHSCLSLWPIYHTVITPQAG